MAAAALGEASASGLRVEPATPSALRNRGCKADEY